MPFIEKFPLYGIFKWSVFATECSFLAAAEQGPKTERVSRPFVLLSSVAYSVLYSMTYTAYFCICLYNMYDVRIFFFEICIPF